MSMNNHGRLSDVRNRSFGGEKGCLDKARKVGSG